MPVRASILTFVSDRYFVVLFNEFLRYGKVGDKMNYSYMKARNKAVAFFVAVLLTVTSVLFDFPIKTSIANADDSYIVSIEVNNIGKFRGSGGIFGHLTIGGATSSGKKPANVEQLQSYEFMSGNSDNRFFSINYSVGAGADMADAIYRNVANTNTHSFVGWYSQEELSSKSYVNSRYSDTLIQFSNVTNNIDVIAVFEFSDTYINSSENNKKIVYDVESSDYGYIENGTIPAYNYVTGNRSYAIDYSINGTEYIDGVTVVEKNGYKFTGWYEDGSDTPISTEYTFVPTGDQIKSTTYTAKFKKDIYFAVADTNKGTVSYDKVTLENGEWKTSSGKTIDKNSGDYSFPLATGINGYTFDGWYTNKDSVTGKLSGKMSGQNPLKYSDSNTIDKLKAMADGATLYAAFKKDYTINYTFDNAYGCAKTRNLGGGRNSTVSSTADKKTGYYTEVYTDSDTADNMIKGAVLTRNQDYSVNTSWVSWRIGSGANQQIISFSTTEAVVGKTDIESYIKLHPSETTITVDSYETRSWINVMNNPDQTDAGAITASNVIRIDFTSDSTAKIEKAFSTKPDTANGYAFKNWYIIGDSGEIHEFGAESSSISANTVLNLPLSDFLKASENKDTAMYTVYANYKEGSNTLTFKTGNSDYGNITLNETTDDSVSLQTAFKQTASGTVSANAVTGLKFSYWESSRGRDMTGFGSSFDLSALGTIENDEVFTAYYKADDGYVVIRYVVSDINNNINYPVTLSMDGKTVSNLTQYGDGNAPEGSQPYIFEIVREGEEAKGCTATVQNVKDSSGNQYRFMGWVQENLYLFSEDNYFQPTGRYLQDTLNDTSDGIITYYAEGRQTKNFYLTVQYGTNVGDGSNIYSTATQHKKDKNGNDVLDENGKVVYEPQRATAVTNVIQFIGYAVIGTDGKVESVVPFKNLNGSNANYGFVPGAQIPDGYENDYWEIIGTNKTDKFDSTLFSYNSNAVFGFDLLEANSSGSNRYNYTGQFAVKNVEKSTGIDAGGTAFRQDIRDWVAEYMYDSVGTGDEYSHSIILKLYLKEKPCTLTVTKTVDEKPVGFGCPSFVFKLSGTEYTNYSHVDYTRAIATDENTVWTKNANGTYTCEITATFSVPRGRYTLSEVDTVRYSVDDKSKLKVSENDDTNGKTEVNGFTVTFNQGGGIAEAAFINDLKNYGKRSYSDSKVNTIPIPAAS